MGAGGIGSITGGFLAKHGQDVAFVGRSDHMSAIERDGLFIDGIWGNHHVSDIRTFTSCEQLCGQTFDLVILSVKSYDTNQAIREARPLVAQDGIVVSFQNGLGNIETIAESVGIERTLGGMVIFGARIEKPGHVTVTVYANEVKIGNPTGAVSYSRVEEIARALNDAGIPTLPTGEIEKHIWGKILYNSTLNPLSAILNATFGELAAEPATREIMSRVADEIFQVAPGRGVELFWKRPQEYLDLFYEQLIPPTAGHYASMLEDLKRGSRTEIESLNGAIVRYGHELNVLCPVNEVLTNIIRVMEQVYGKPFDETKM